MSDLFWFDWLALAGGAVIAGAFLLLQLALVEGRSLVYQLLNLLGALALAVALVFGHFHLGAFVLLLVWIVISGYGLARRWNRPTSG